MEIIYTYYVKVLVNIKRVKLQNKNVVTIKIKVNKPRYNMKLVKT